MELFLNDKVALWPGDCLEVLAGFEAESFDSCVTDPPYHLTSIVKRFGKKGSAPAQFGSDGRYSRLSGGFMNKKWDAPDLPAIDPAFAYWMAGFIDGEGCFHVHKKQVNNCETYDCQFSITLRADDKDVVVEMQRQLGGIGSISDRPAPKDSNNSKPQVRFCVSSQRDCWRLREVLTVFPLRAKKARDFEIWSCALDAWIAHEPGESWEDVAYFRDALMAVRRYGADFHPSQLWAYRWAREVFRVLKPGGHLIAFGGTRTYHRMACAIEDAGFEIRDQIGWAYGSGFPKSHNVGHGIDRTLGCEPEVVAEGPTVRRIRPGADQDKDGSWEKLTDRTYTHRTTLPGSAEGRQWQGWGTALKPAWEPLVLARRPLRGTVAQNVLACGVGALNIGGCRVGTEEHTYDLKGSENLNRLARIGGNDVEDAAGLGAYGVGAKQVSIGKSTAVGRWPANLCHDGSEEVLAAFPESEGCQPHTINSANEKYEGWGSITNKNGEMVGYEGGGSAARFFFTAKADSNDRLGSKHPTVKPLDLMQWLVRLVTPPCGAVLDPFAGTGSTGEAAWREGFRSALIEREPEYQADIRRRMAYALAGPDERRAAGVKAAGKIEDAGPLFTSR